MLYGAKVSKLGFLVSGGYESSEGFRENSELSAKDCNLKLGYELNSENNLSFNSGFYKSKAGAPGTINYFDVDDKQNVLKRFFDLNWKFQPDEQTGLSVKTYQNYDRLEFMENTAGPTWGDVANQKDIHATTVRGLDLQLDKQLLDIYGVVCGFNYVKNMNDSTSSAKHEYNVTSGYLENRLDLFDKKLNINLSARLDDYSNFGTEINPSLGLVYKFNENMKIHGLISRSFRAPTFNDLYWSSPGMLSNPDLEPEKGLTGEIGVESKLNDRILFGVTYYRSKYNKLIQWAPLTDDPYGDWSVKNIGSAIIDGIELSNNIYITESLEADLNYTYMIAKDAQTHEFLIYQPQNKVDFCLKYKDLKGFQIEIKGQFVGRSFTNSSNTASLKQFFVFGLSVSKKFKSGITCFGYIDNLLNRKYQVQNGYPMPGFSLTGGFKAEF
jgi:iron complex outermembrane receptor protein